MSIISPVRRNEMREKLAELKSAAIAELERRGYDVRGKTPAQIRQILKRRPSKQKSAPIKRTDAPKRGPRWVNSGHSGTPAPCPPSKADIH